MIKLKTNYPIAIDSADHKFPAGSINDNNSNVNYILEIKNFFKNAPIKVLDLGCSGGQIIVDHLKSGDMAVGLEGSDTVLNGKGSHNWKQFLNKNLFLCDITEHFDLEDENDQIIQFDVIQMWDVLEHIPENKIANLFANIRKHLKNEGIFIGQISQQNDPIHHISNFSFEKWKSIFNQNKLILNDYTFFHVPRYRLSLGKVDPYGNNESGFCFNSKKLN